MLTHLTGEASRREHSTPGAEIIRSGWGAPGVVDPLRAGLPGIWLCNDQTGGLPPVVQRTLLPAGADIRTISLDGRPVGVAYRDDAAEYALVMGVGPEDLAAGRVRQAESVFEQLERALADAGFAFTDTVRTWFYLDRLLEWYDDFNRVRDAFFASRGVFGGFVPASTGIGSANTTGSAILAGAFAMRVTHPDRASKSMLPSPLQCPATDYRSSFSRAAEIAAPAGRTILVSGTASIEPGGATAHVGDPARQIALTMDVVEAILVSRRMDWRDTVRAVAYIKRPEDRVYWQHWLAEHGLPGDFAQEIIADVCRDDLLFELELDAFVRA